MINTKLQDTRSTDELWNDASELLNSQSLHKESDCAAAFELLLKAAQKGHKAAQKQVADMLKEGRGTDRDYILALQWYEIAAQDCITNTLWLADAYMEGKVGISAEPSEAARLYKAMADKGDSIALYELACLHETGLGVERNYALTRKLLNESAQKGHAPAQIKLSEFYASGKGGPADEALAEHWRTQAQITPKLEN